MLALIFCLLSAVGVLRVEAADRRIGLIATLIATLLPAVPSVAASKGVVVTRQTNAVTVATCHLKLDMDLATGFYGVTWTGGSAISGASCEAKLSDGRQLIASDYTQHECLAADVTRLKDKFGDGVKVVVHHRTPNQPELRQEFRIYRSNDYFLTQLDVVSPTSISANYITPLVADDTRIRNAGLHLDAGDKPRTLFIPYDNDTWDRFNSDYATSSYEVTAAFDNGTRHGLVVGSVSHDLWKTGLTMGAFAPRTVGSFCVYGGAAGGYTHDTQPHGFVSGTVVSSPSIFVGCFQDWRDGMETYGRVNSRIAPAPAWKGGPPFGWNTWYPFGTSIRYDDYLKTSEIFQKDLTPLGFQDDRTVYINLDAWWPLLTDSQVANAIRLIHSRGQKAGIYWAPFSRWTDDLDAPAPHADGGYHVSDIFLKDSSGKPLPKIDGAHPLDVTHPATLQAIDWQMKQFVDWGIDYVKLDFLNAGALEGAHYDPAITTGTAAYNLAMKRIVKDLGRMRSRKTIYIDLGIAPLFPNYGQSRMISCEVHNELSNCEFELNALTYGWWAAGTLYDFINPDMIWLSSSEAVARTRVNTCVVTGGMLIDGDDLTKPSPLNMVRKLLTNKDMLALARSGRTFRPVEGDVGPGASDTFVRYERSGSAYVAVFNWDGKLPAVKHIDLARLGLNPKADFRVKDLWSGSETRARESLSIELVPAESTILRLTKVGK